MIAGIGLVIMSTMVFAQVVMRYVFHAPMSWSDEIAVYCMVWSVYLSASWTVREQGPIKFKPALSMAATMVSSSAIKP